MEDLTVASVSVVISSCYYGKNVCGSINPEFVNGCRRLKRE